MLVEPYKNIRTFQQAFKLKLKARPFAATREMINSIMNPPLEASILDAKNMMPWHKELVEFRVNELNQDTQNGRRNKTLLFDAYTNYSVFETACSDGFYGGYLRCREDAPKCSNDGWPYPML